MKLRIGISAFALSAFALALVWAMPLRSVAQTALESARWTEVDAALGAAAEQERRQQLIPSIAIGIVDSNGSRWQNAFGYSDAAKSRSSDVHDLYRIGPLAHLGLLESLSTPRPSVRNPASVPKRTLTYGEMAPYDDVRSAAPEMPRAADDYLYASVAELSDAALALLTKRAPPNQHDRSLDGHRVIEYEASSYGYVTDVSIYPDDGFAVIVLVALDSAYPAERRLQEFAARSVLAAKAGESAPHYPAPSDAPPASIARTIAGHYANGASSLEIRVVEGRTYLEAPDVAAELRRSGDRWILDDVLTGRDDVAVDTAAGNVTLGGVTYRRTARPRPAPPDEELSRLMGDYGERYSYLRIYERDGHTYVRIGPSDYEPLERMNGDLYRLARDPKRELQILRGRKGMPEAIRFEKTLWKRHDFGAETEAKIHASVREVPGLRENAWKATPPAAEPGRRAPDLVEVVRIEPGIKLDIRYATRNNFMGIAVYDEPRAFLQRPAAEALVRAHEKLGKEYGFGILIHDTYRPWAVTKMFWDATPPSEHDFVADPAKGSKHNRGCAADITLYDRASGEMLEMTGRYDETSARSVPMYVGGSSLQRWRRDVLKDALEAEGFAVYRYEWWHFDHQLWTQYPVMNVNFRDVPN